MKHRWFQIHLSTIFMSVMLSATFLLVNFSPKEITWFNRRQWPDHMMIDKVYGWPCDVYLEGLGGGWQQHGLAFNAVTFVAIQLSVVVVLESRIRRRATPKP